MKTLATAGMGRLVGHEIARLHQIKTPQGMPNRFTYGLEPFDEVKTSRSDKDYRA